MSWSAVLLGLWMVGASLIAGRLVAGVIAVHWMSRRIERVTDAPWLAQARSLAAEVSEFRLGLFFSAARGLRCRWRGDSSGPPC